MATFALALFPGQATAERLATCPKNLEIVALCGQIDGSTLTVTGTQQQPGTNTDTDTDTTSPQPSVPNPDGPSNKCNAEAMSPLGCRPTRGVPTTNPGTPPITIEDLAQFTPDPVTTLGEPANIGIAGLPTNFITTAPTTTRTGTLLGHPLTVRFTPTTYEHHYGDGTTRTTPTPGHTWTDLHQPQFTPTPTSHTYHHPGTYTATVNITYTAEINLGTGWQPITGHLTTHGPTQNIHIFTAHTALVTHTCTEQPTAPGC